MSFDAHEEKIRKMLSGDSRFSIPRNQRRYVWNEKQWKELLDDVMYIYKCRQRTGTDINHFFGSFVLQEEGNAYEVIDGQQRITTVLLMLSAMCMIFNERGEKEEHGVTRQYLCGNIGLKSQYMRIENEANANIELILSAACQYREELSRGELMNYNHVYRSDEGSINAVRCFEFFYNYLADNCGSVECLVVIRDIVLDMKVIHISSENELDCYDIFEILNARGVELEESELLKNFIFKYAQPRYTVIHAKEMWGGIERNLDVCKGNVDLFLSNFVTYRYAKPTRDENVFRLIKSNVGKDNADILLEELLKSSEVYMKFYEPDREKCDGIRKCLQLFRLLNHRLFRPLIMALYEATSEGYYTEKQMSDICLFLRNYVFGYTMVMGNNSNAIETKIHELSKKIYQMHTTDILNEIRQTLLVFYPSYQEFENSFFNMGFSNKNKKYRNSSNKRRVYYIFQEMEEYYQSTSELICNVSECNIEHILSDSETEDCVARIGNLLLISESINSNMGDEDFAEKKKKMERSRLVTVRNFLRHYGTQDAWNAELIEKRTKAIAKVAYEEIWNIEC